MVIRDVMAVTQITSRIVFVPALKTYQIELLMITHKNGYLGVISVTERTRLADLLKWKVRYRIDVYTIPLQTAIRHS